MFINYENSYKYSTVYVKCLFKPSKVSTYVQVRYVCIEIDAHHPRAELVEAVGSRIPLQQQRLCENTGPSVISRMEEDIRMPT